MKKQFNNSLFSYPVITFIIFICFILILACISSSNYCLNGPDVKLLNTNNLYDWECIYMIEDGYHSQTYYVDNYIKNQDGSISVVGNDGLIINIPSPYYVVTKNPKITGRK